MSEPRILLCKTELEDNPDLTTEGDSKELIDFIRSRESLMEGEVLDRKGRFTITTKFIYAAFYDYELRKEK